MTYSAHDLVKMIPEGCHLCGKTDGVIGWDHVVPLVRGGPDSLKNIKPAHWACNRRKGRRLMSEMR